MHFVNMRRWAAAALFCLLVLLLSNSAYASAVPTVTVANVSGFDGQPVSLVFTFNNPLSKSVSFEVEGDSQHWGVCSPDGDCASVHEFEFEPTVRPNSTLQKTINLASTGFDDGETDSWHFTFSGNYSWESEPGEGHGTYSALVTLTDTNTTFTNTPEPGTLLLISSGAMSLLGIGRRRFFS